MNLAFAYTLAGADCIDMSADEAVVTAANEVSKAVLGIHRIVRCYYPRLTFFGSAPFINRELNQLYY